MPLNVPSNPLATPLRLDLAIISSPPRDLTSVSSAAISLPSLGPIGCNTELNIDLNDLDPTFILPNELDGITFFSNHFSNVISPFLPPNSLLSFSSFTSISLNTLLN